MQVVCAGPEPAAVQKNDGQGVFFAVAIANVQSSNELNADDHDVEVIDLNGDSFLDLVTLHDGLYARNG